MTPATKNRLAEFLVKDLDLPAETKKEPQQIYNNCHIGDKNSYSFTFIYAPTNSNSNTSNSSSGSPILTLIAFGVMIWIGVANWHIMDDFINHWIK